MTEKQPATTTEQHPDATVADVIVERLGDWSVDRVFGYSGDGVNGILEALKRTDGAIEFVQARHEENAAFMAVGQAKYAGGAGVVTSTQGPGAVHLLNGLYDAKLDRVPVVAIIGQQNRSVLGSGYMQEIDLRTLFADVGAQFITEITTPGQVPMAIDRAFRAALDSRSPAVVIVPHDVQSAPAPELPHKHGIVTTSEEFATPLVHPSDAQLQSAAEVLNAGERIALLVGKGASRARDQVEAMADRLGAAIVTSLLGKAYVDEARPNAAGVMGHLGTTASAGVLTECDTLLIVGSNDPWTEFYPNPDQARAVQIDISAAHIANRYPVEVGLIGEASGTLTALLDLVDDKSDADWAARVREHVSDWHRVSDERAAVPMEPINPEAAVRALSPHVPEDAQIAVDVGSVVYWYARQLHLPTDVPAHVSGTLASMGCGIPYGIAAKLAYSERPVIVLSGDGGMQMTGLAELVTVAARWESWADPRFVIAILNNRDLAEVSWEQRENEGMARFRQTQALPDVRYSEYANLLGLDGERVTDPDELDGAWQRGLSADRPFVLDIVTDPATPLVPPLAQASAKLDSMRTALESESGELGERARQLLEEYVRIEQGE
ncbi:thiamine pyrophosphate-requiring protein [Paramicrobacterium agarici]|uniref:Pyruvate dehydrogenase (Quinone) n=1 Tax=Paramicrobacterium agarici TaxID=630514 RepID=A0A2A9DSM2_9MICO|nr:thiamine pyrophosphate-requiring protein [Microbacterium agarici]PFG29787.1 pyruvate dehydrogenase (quinone) [Microbacterium agarici]